MPRTNHKSEIRNQKSRGAAIMLALWALFLLSAMVISWALDISARLAIAGNASRVLEAEAMACSGAEVALHPLVKPGSPNLFRSVGDRKGYEARITGEGGRIDINYFAARADQDPRFRQVLIGYLENKGIDLNERDTMIDSLLDWVLPNTGLHRLNAPPESDNYHPAHTPPTRIEELKKVFGWAEFTSEPNWDRDLTVNTQQPIDLAWASRDVLLALGLTDGIVDHFLELRHGRDGIDGTLDDGVRNRQEALVALGLNPQQTKELEGLIAPQWDLPIRRVISVGKSGEARRTVQFVFRRTGNVPVLSGWKEF